MQRPGAAFAAGEGKPNQQDQSPMEQPDGSVPDADSADVYAHSSRPALRPLLQANDMRLRRLGQYSTPRQGLDAANAAARGQQHE